MEKLEIDLEQRRQLAIDNFMNGYNCAQSIFLAYVDVFDLDPHLAKRLSGSFGGGMGRLREVCGAVTGMFMILGLHYSAVDPSRKDVKTANYAAVQRVANAFKAQFGTIICRELLGITQAETYVPSDRTAEYYASRPCARFIGEAAVIVGKELMNEF
ncbi:MAG: C-GCAxxG-C-C family protein [Microbacter sp.]